MERYWHVGARQPWRAVDIFPGAPGPFMRADRENRLERELFESWHTLAIATASMTLALGLALPLTLASTRVLLGLALRGRMPPLPAVVRHMVRLLLIVLRNEPKLVWAFVFVRVVGLGPTAGVLAIALTCGGMRGKVYCGIIESGERHEPETLPRNGRGRQQAFAYDCCLKNAGELVSCTVYRWECAVRSSVVLGVVGTGGLGQLLAFHTGLFQMGKTATILVAMLLLVAAVDALSHGLRRLMTR